jgi:hypothetical protein
MDQTLLSNVVAAVVFAVIGIVIRWGRSWRSIG